MEGSDDARERTQRDERTEDSEIEVLRLRYTELQQENLRLRTARGALTRELGPLPISAAVVAGLVSGFGAEGSVHLHKALAICALGLFALMVLVSVGHSRLLPYRKLRAANEPGDRLAVGSSGGRVAERAWYTQMFELEQAVRDGGRAVEREQADGTDEQTVDRQRAAPTDETRAPSRSWRSRVLDPLGSAEEWLWEALRAAFWPRSPSTLDSCYDVEWRGVFITKALFVLVIVLLILARIA
jgi:hypothetical protein